MNIIHFTHDDADALGCALIPGILYGLSDENHCIDTQFCSIGNVDDKIKDFIYNVEHQIYDYEYDMVIISDIGPSAEVLDKLESTCLKFRNVVTFIGVDHHQTNALHEEFDWFNVKVTDDNGVPNSACKLLFNYFSDVIKNRYDENTYNYIKKFIEDVSRYDTWLWKHDPIDETEDALNIVIKSYGSISEAYNNLLYNFDKTKKFFFEKEFLMIDNYRIKQKAKINDLGYRTPFVYTEMGEYFVIMFLPDSDFGNEQAHELLEANTDIDFTMGLYPSTKSISLRSERDDINLGRYCLRLYGGGGHKQAAGARLSTEEFLELLKKYYDLLEEGVK